jgi:hypothetical protein
MPSTRVDNKFEADSTVQDSAMEGIDYANVRKYTHLALSREHIN